MIPYIRVNDRKLYTKNVFCLLLNFSIYLLLSLINNEYTQAYVLCKFFYRCPPPQISLPLTFCYQFITLQVNGNNRMHYPRTFSEYRLQQNVSDNVCKSLGSQIIRCKYEIKRYAEIGITRLFIDRSAVTNSSCCIYGFSHRI